MRTPIRPTLRDLQIGDKFYRSSQQFKKRRVIYEVLGKPQFHNVLGISIRKCKRVDINEEQDIACFLEVVKLFYCIECGAKVPDGEKYCNECVIVE